MEPVVFITYLEVLCKTSEGRGRLRTKEGTIGNYSTNQQGIYRLTLSVIGCGYFGRILVEDVSFRILFSYQSSRKLKKNSFPCRFIIVGFKLYLTIYYTYIKTKRAQLYFFRSFYLAQLEC